MADWVYCAGTDLQLIAFTMGGMRPVTLGIALVVYGVGVTWFASGWK